MKIPFLKKTISADVGITPQDKIPGIIHLYYSLPIFSAGILNYLIAQYYMKYATDVLRIAPGIMGSIFLASRVWDAINDPIIGHWSDRTRSSRGRRIPWIFFSEFPTLLFFVLLWLPLFTENKAFQAAAITVFMLGFFTSITGIYIPHYSLGAELTSHPHERNKIYGIRAVFENVGNIVGVIIMSVMIHAGSGTIVAMVAGVAFLSFTGNSVILRLGQNGKTPSAPDSAHYGFFVSAKAALKNVQARVVYAAGFFSQMGATFVLIMTLYYAEYVLATKEFSGLYVGVFMISAILSIFLWIILAKKISKKNLWIVINLFLATGFLSTRVIHSGNAFLMIPLSLVLGSLAGGSLVINPSMLADAMETPGSPGNSTEGIYFSFFTFINKSAMGLAAAVTGFLLEFSGFVPGQIQTSETVRMLSISYGFFPFLFFLLSAFSLGFYRSR